MRLSSESMPSFSTAGLLAALVSACQILGGLIWVSSPAFVSGGYVNAGLIASLCISVLVLSRLTLPNGIRALLVLGVITVLLGIAVRADLTGVKQVSDAVSNVARQGPAMAAQPEDQALDPARRGVSSRTVQVQLRPGEGGDGGWAARLNEAARVQIEGEAPAEIHGVVTLEGGSDARPRIGWAVNWAGATLSCGRLTAVVVTRPEGLTNQVIGTFRRSLSRTAALKRPSCY